MASDWGSRKERTGQRLRCPDKAIRRKREKKVKIPKRAWLILAASMLLGSVHLAFAQKAAPVDLFLKGDAKCTECHDESDNPRILHLGKTKHGTTADGRTPTCTNCHGESSAHLKGGTTGTNKRPAPDVVFKTGGAL